jgi:hypothetical protein
VSPSEDLLKLWARVEGHLRGALSVVEVDASTRRMSEEFLDHNELGLAFQTLVGALADGGTTPPPAAHTHLAAAAAEMSLQDDPDWRRLNSPGG